MSLIHETDYGTPASMSADTVTLSIDGQQVTVPAGTSIMRAAMDTGIQVPKLCATDSLDSFGSCRLCLVEIAGRAGTPASCTTPVAEGLVVATQSERLKKLRRGEMHRLLALRAGLRGGAGHLRVDDRRARLRLESVGRHERGLPRLRMRL